jgi:hypothetical protein
MSDPIARPKRRRPALGAVLGMFLPTPLLSVVVLDSCGDPGRGAFHDRGSVIAPSSPPASSQAPPAHSGASAGTPSASGAIVAPPDTRAAAETIASGAPAGEPSAPSPAPSPCPDGMTLVEGEYCPLVEQLCLERGGEESGAESDTICRKFDRPSKCVAPRRVPMRFCMDRHEYPNEPGHEPLTLVSWRQAAHLCAEHGKRLCSESEFNFACEGEEMLPYATGFDRPAAACNVDKPFRGRPGELKPSAECARDKACAAELARLDQREPIGSHPACVSPFGVHDLNGNANEWVMLRYKKAPHRAALKGGWWGPVRARCRPIVTSHDETYIGYEVGFRCCKGLGATARRSGARRSSAR